MLQKIVPNLNLTKKKINDSKSQAPSSSTRSSSTSGGDIKGILSREHAKRSNSGYAEFSGGSKGTRYNPGSANSNYPTATGGKGGQPGRRTRAKSYGTTYRAGMDSYIDTDFLDDLFDIL